MGWPKGRPQTAEHRAKTAASMRGQRTGASRSLAQAVADAERTGKWRKTLLTPHEVARLLIEQGGECAFATCRAEPQVIDHDHISGEVRGLLCEWHNLTLGHLRDDPDEAMAAIAYLRRSGDATSVIVANTTA